MTETMTAETGAAAAYRAPGAAVVRVMVAVTRCALTVRAPCRSHLSCRLPGCTLHRLSAHTET